MFLSVIDLVKVLSEAQVASIGIPVLSLVAVVCVMVGSTLDRRKYTRLIAAYDLAEEKRLEHLAASAQQACETQNQRLGEATLLLDGLTELTYSLCDTDELTEAWRQEECEACGEEYQQPSPMDGCQELFIEVNALHKALSQSARDLEESRSQDSDIEFYREWAAQLHERYSQWRARRQTIADLKQLEARLDRLEQVLCRIHGARKAKWQDAMSRFPQRIETYQSLYETAVCERKLIGLRIQKLEDASKQGITLDIAADTEAVELLERFHEKLDGGQGLIDLFTMEGIKAEAKERWHDVISYASETRFAFLQECLAESNEKYLRGFTQARRVYMECGPCGQKKAAEMYREALVHWSCSQAILLILREQIDHVEDFTDQLTLAQNAYCFDLALLGRTQQDQTSLARAIQTFHETFERSCPTLSLSSL
jgi:hypothetical protein